MQRVLLPGNTRQRVREFQSKKFCQYADNRNCLSKHIFLQPPWCLRRMWSVETLR